MPTKNIERPFPPLGFDVAFLNNLFKPKWQHSDPRVRLRAVANLPEAEQATLGRIAAADADAEVRRAAQARINDWHLLASLIASVSDQTIGRELRARIDDLQLSELSAAPVFSAKLAILDLITTESLLARIAVEEADADIRLAAVARISNQELLAEVVTKKCGKIPALLAIDKLTDESLLRQATRQAASRSARARAQHKVEQIEIERNRPSPEAQQELELTSLMERARCLSEGGINGSAVQECRQLERRWREIAGPGEARTVQFEEYCAAFRARHQEETAREEARLAARREHDVHLDRLHRIVDEIQILIKSMAGGEEERFAVLQQEWTELQTALNGPLPAELEKRYDEECAHFAESRTLLVEESAAETSLLRLLDQIPPLLEAMELEQALTAISEGQRVFDGWRPRLLSRQQVAARLCLLRDQHREAGTRQEAVQATRLQANWALRKELVQELLGLLTAEDLRQAEQRVKEIKEIWSRPVELPEASEDLEPGFAEACRLFGERLEAARKEEGWQRWQNKNLKTQLIEEAEDLDEVSDLRQVFKRIKELQEGWRLLGPAPAKDEKALWRRFQQATDRNFGRCRLFFQALDDEAERNLQEKMRLRDLVVAQQESNEWQKTAEFIKSVQAQWKAVGPGPRDKEQEVFQAFRAACDHFFERRKAHHAVLDQERLANLAQKEILCQQAESLADQPDSAHKLQFQELQGAWKAIGPVPKEQEEVIWQRFRAACDRYYVWLDSLRPDNLAQKEALCAEVEGLTAAIGPNPNFVQLAKKVVALQRRWKEIGPVPLDLQEAIWQRFKGSCDAFFAAKAEHDEEIDRQRPENQAKKEGLLARIKELSAAPFTREMVREIIATQEEWQQIGPAGKERERQLQQEFTVVCDAFFKERREAMQEVDEIQRDHLKKKEALCLRLEILAGINPPPVIQESGRRQSGLTLAEQLKVALETNFVMSTDDALDKKRRAKDEIEAIKQEWPRIGQVPREHEQGIRKRFNEAMAAALKLCPSR